MRFAAAALTALLVAAPMAAQGASQPSEASARTAPAPADPVFPRGLPAAPSEDSCYAYRCVWDARHAGNGEGHSLILTRFHEDFIGKRITHRRAHRLLNAWCARPNVGCIGYEDK
jgi:hypothetical protein